MSDSIRPNRRATLGAIGGLPLLALAGGCAEHDTPGSGDERALTVFAAASLTDVFEGIVTAFEDAHSGVSVVMTNAGSSDLITQIGQGAPADVLATADEATMDRAVSEGLIAGEPSVFASNVLVIAVAPGNPLGIATLADLEGEDVAVVRCATPVPCGTVADEVLSAAGVALSPVSEENSVTDVLGKVTSGSADAGLVYATDVTRAEGKAEGIEIPEAADLPTDYPIAVTSGASQPELAAEFLEHVLASASSAALQDAGFLIP